ncbi:MAG: type IV pilus assembly protein PilV [Oleispira sp.]|jgi:type IV pilus assembly protein PilV
MPNSKGIGLLEVLVTIVITSIGLMGLVSLQLQAVRATTDSGNRSQAIWIFNDIVSRIHANEVSSDSYIINTPINCNNVPAATCSAYHTGTTLIAAAAACTGQQLAQWDLFEVACGAPKNDTASTIYYGNSIQHLPDAQLTIICADTSCEAGDDLIVKLQWRARMDTESITGAARTTNSGLLFIQDKISP